MTTYTILFTFFGKKYKHTIQADNKEIAIQKIKDKIVIDKCERSKLPIDPFDYLKTMFGI